MRNAERSTPGSPSRRSTPTNVAALSLLIAALTLSTPSAPADTGSAITVREFTFEHDNRLRYYTVAEPSTYAPGAPVVVLLHGGGQSMRRVLETTSAPSRWLDLAAQDGFLLIVPNGWNTPTQSGAGDQQTWNDLRPTDATNISEEDDAGFVARVMACEAARRGFDRRSVFVTGSSNGGMLTYRLLIEFPEIFTAGAAFIANLPAEPVPNPAIRRPVMIMNGDADPLMPWWRGGTVGINGAPVRSGPDTVAYWQAVNQVKSASTGQLLPNTDPFDGARIVRYDFFAQPAEPPPVVLYRVVGGGHSIPVLPTDPQEPLPPRSAPAAATPAASTWLGRSSRTTCRPARPTSGRNPAPGSISRRV